MKLTIEDQTYTDIKDLVAGFVTDGQAESLKFHLLASPTLTFDMAFQLIQSITINILHAFVEQKPEALEDVYDAYNFMASSILNNIIPDKELRKDLTAEAIIKAEDELIKKKAQKASAKDKAAAKKKIDKLKKDVKNV